MARKVCFNSRAILIVLLSLALAAEIPLLVLSILIFADSQIGTTILIDIVLILLAVSLMIYLLR